MNRNILAFAAAAILGTSTAGLAQGEATLSDAEIAHIAYTAGKIDADAAKQALAKSRNRQVRQFAETMLRDHVAVNEQALALVKKLGVVPKDNGTSAALSRGAAAKMRQLSALSGRSFDRAYAQNEAAYHRTVNAALRTTLIPNSRNPELKSLLETGLALFRAHQAHAEQLARQIR